MKEKEKQLHERKQLNIRKKSTGRNPLPIGEKKEKITVFVKGSNFDKAAAEIDKVVQRYNK